MQLGREACGLVLAYSYRCRMKKRTVIGAKSSFVLFFTVLLWGQVVAVPNAMDYFASVVARLSSLKVPVAIGCILLMACAQIILVCGWRLLSLVDHDKFFSRSALLWLNLMLGTCFVLSLLAIPAIVTIFTVLPVPPWTQFVVFSAFAGGMAGVFTLINVKQQFRKYMATS